MQAEEAQLQYMHLYKKMDAVYYQMAIAQKLTPSETIQFVCWGTAVYSGTFAIWH